MLRTLTINSNQSMLSFGVLIAFLSPKQSEIEESSLESISKIQNARSIYGQGVRIHHRRASGQHIRVGISPGCSHFAPGCRHLHRMCAAIFAPSCRHLHPNVRRHFLHPGCRHCIRLPRTSTRMFTSGILTPDRKGERFNFSGRTYPDHLIAVYPDGRAAILHNAAVFS